MKLLTKAQHMQMLKNGEIAERNPAFDPHPVVKLFTPDGAATWLLASLDPTDPDIAFGLCDLGLGFPELGTVRLSEIAAIRGKISLRIERDRHWTATAPLSAYARASIPAQRIVDRL